MATALNTAVGYETAAKVVKHALTQNLSLQAAGQALGIDPTALGRALNVEEIAKAVPREGSSSADHGGPDLSTFLKSTEVSAKGTETSDRDIEPVNDGIRSSLPKESVATRRRNSKSVQSRKQDENSD